MCPMLRVVVSADTDFDELLALGGASMPSVTLLRRRHDPDDQIQAILGVLPDASGDLVACDGRVAGDSSNETSNGPLETG